ncbi:Copia protein [Rhynchospora pubera]|uniref:Copia protein n=1 Tax=Rhynchospora pubera TaxID=906938 RepID=A0AAV8DHN6_9POAL|nr:Copia protein [Rhynchospora pubera]
MAGASSTTLSSLPTSSSSPINIIHLIHTFLNQDNFLLWRSQVLLVLRGHALIGYIDGSKKPPDATNSTRDGNQISNPDFDAWQQQDQLILAWLFSSISPSMLSQVVNCQTSYDLWQTVTHLHTSQSMARVLDLKLQLQTAKRGNSSCAQYIQQMQTLADRLRSIGETVTDTDLVIYTLQGLGTKFDTFVTTFSMRGSSPSMAEFSNLLLAHEARVQTSLRNNTTSTINLTENSIPSVIGTSTGTPNQAAFYAQQNRNRISTSNSYPSRGRGNGGRGRNGNRGRGRGRQNTAGQDNSQCQICSKWGHTALECYHRFDIRYFTSPQQPAQQISQQAPQQALLAEPSAEPQPNWYVDSGAVRKCANFHFYTNYQLINQANIAHTRSSTQAIQTHERKGWKSTSLGIATKRLVPTDWCRWRALQEPPRRAPRVH